MKIYLLAFLSCWFCNIVTSQTIDKKIEIKNQELLAIENQRTALQNQLEILKLQQIREELENIGLPAVLPGDELIKHTAFYLSFVPEYKQARWVAHIITPEIINGVIVRSNDFRIDSAVKSGSAIEADYFTKSLNADGTYTYNGFGYDRGHLAPSADFRWSRIALSESYYYSNMAPQLAEFNRGAWGDLEDIIRSYIFRNNKTRLYVVTGPIFDEGLPKIEKGTHKLPIPKRFYKVALDLQNKKAIGFIMPNELISKSIKSYAVSVDEVEKLTNLDFFKNLPLPVQSSVEGSMETKDWFPVNNEMEVEPLPQEKLPRNHFNTIIAKQSIGRNETISVCGTVVGSRLSRAGNILINLDKPFPNQVFTIFVKKEDIVNFSFNPVEGLKSKVICVKGKVIDLAGTPTMYISKESELQIQ